MSKHTPGPWTWELNFPCSKRITLLGPSQKIKDAVLDFDDGILRVNGEWLPRGKKIPPDLLLIAAAPELLEALEEIVRFNVPLPNGLLDQAMAAIAKSTRIEGEENL